MPRPRPLCGRPARRSRPRRASTDQASRIPSFRRNRASHRIRDSARVASPSYEARTSRFAPAERATEVTSPRVEPEPPGTHSAEPKSCVVCPVWALLVAASTRGSIRPSPTTRVVEARLKPVSHRLRAIPPWHVQVLFQTGNTFGLAPATPRELVPPRAPPNPLPRQWFQHHYAGRLAARSALGLANTPRGVRSPGRSPRSRRTWFGFRNPPCPLGSVGVQRFGPSLACSDPRIRAGFR